MNISSSLLDAGVSIVESPELNYHDRVSCIASTLVASTGIQIKGGLEEWKMSHPSAIEHFEKFKRMAEGRKLAVFLDYDGTLTPIVSEPERAYMSDEMRLAVKRLSERYPTAIVSGRGREKVYEFVQLPELVYAGSHGMDISDGSTCRGGKAETSAAEEKKRLESYCAAKEYEDTIDEVYTQLQRAVMDIEFAEVEHNKFCVSVHYRNCDPGKWSEVQTRVEEVMSTYDCLRMTKGRKVFEVRPSIEWDKGKAVEYLLDAFGLGNSADVLPVYIGDDKTDEDAFRVIRQRGRGCAILVSAVVKETLASYTLKDPSEVLQFLKLLASLAL